VARDGGTLLGSECAAVTGTAAAFTVEIPLPPKALSPNVGKKSWRAKWKATQKYRRTCLAYLTIKRPRDWIAQGCFELEVQYRVHRADIDVAYRPLNRPYHPKDEDNARASLKALVDALRDARLIPTDAHGTLRWGRFELFTTERAVVKTGKSRGITVTVRRVP
jgi:hypothetical protein